MSTRSLYAISFIIIFMLLSAALYLQIFQNAHPCPLCSLQRIVFLCLAFLFLFAMIFFYKKIWQRLINSFLSFSFSMIGLFLSGRQIYLQYYPNHQVECGASIEYLFSVLPLREFIERILLGGTECSQRGWELFSLTIAEWSFGWFGFFLLLSIYLFAKEIKR